VRPATRLVTSGRQYSEHGIVSPGVYHASTILYPSADALRAGNQQYTYGRKGTPTSRALEDTIAALEGGHACKVTPSGWPPFRRCSWRFSIPAIMC
jgi:cystathionine beta-lyase